MDTSFTATLTTTAIERLITTMHAVAPGMALRARSWMAGLTRTGHAADYFQHPLAFPMLLIPCWVEEALVGEVDVAFQQQLIYSSVSGYYFIRMIDNVMDEHSELERRLLPMTGFFHAQATIIYHQYFEHQHPFWGHFSRWNTQSADFAIEDGSQQDIDLETFRRVAGKKVVAGKIPLAAVLARYDRLEQLAHWEEFYDKLSCWHQLLNDLLSWHRDSQHHTASYFLCEGQRRKQEHETLLMWLMREGFAWGLTTLQTWLAELLQMAEAPGSPALKNYLLHRQQLLNTQINDLTNSTALLFQLIHASHAPVSIAEGKSS